LLLLFAACGEFFIRAPLRLLHGTEWNDFLSPYIQSRAWLEGSDPYNLENFVKFWPHDKPIFTFVKKDAAAGTLAFNRGVPSPYPITSFVVLVPFGLLPWNAAETLWLLLNVSALVFVIAGLVALARVPWRDTRAWVFAAFTLGLAPIHTGLFTANPIVLVLGLGVAALCAARQDRDGLAALALTIAMCLKPQVGLCFLIFFLVQRRWKPVLACCGMSAAIFLLAVVRLAAAGAPWWISYLNVSQSVFARGGINDFTPANPIWFQMINLQVAFFPLLPRAAAANILAASVGLGFAVLWLLCALKRSRDSDHLLTLSALAVISLLPVYHRFYDAALLVFPAAWAVMGGRLPRKAAWSSLGLAALFLTPGGVLISRVAERTHVSAAFVTSWWWRSFIVAHQVWALFLLAIVLLIAMRRAGGDSVNEQVGNSESAEPVPQAI
jgi:hypothetical protein